MTMYRDHFKFEEYLAYHSVGKVLIHLMLKNIPWDNVVKYPFEASIIFQGRCSGSFEFISKMGFDYF